MSEKTGERTYDVSSGVKRVTRRRGSSVRTPEPAWRWGCPCFTQRGTGTVSEERDGPLVKTINHQNKCKHVTEAEASLGM